MTSKSKNSEKKIVLYRKWRPQVFSEVIAQDHIKKTLQNAIVKNRISHAYIFCGSRGTGKTSMARILAKAVNCTNSKSGEPCNECKNCSEISSGRSLDLIEIDGASNRGIDEIRDLREKIRFSPSSALYKVFIIDEVHMLTREAFNALLKTLEEPPEHAIFILVTTEIHKIPPTVLSRCQRFDFERISVEDLINRLYFIAGKENLNIDKKALRLIAQNAEGGLRDAISLLDQLISYGGKNINLDQIRSVLGLVDIKTLEELTDLLIKKDTTQAIKLVNNVFSKGYDLHQFAKGMIEYLRSILIVKLNQDEKILHISPDQFEKILSQSKEIELDGVLKLIKLFIKAEKDLKLATFPQLPLELVLIEANKENFNVSQDDVSNNKANADDKEKEISNSQNLESKNPPKKSVKNLPDNFSNGKEDIDKDASQVQKNKINDKSTNKVNSLNDGVDLKKFLDLWDEVLEEVKNYNHSVRAFLKASHPIDIKDDKITLEFFYAFHKERIEDDKNRSYVEKAIEKVTNRSYKVYCTLGKKDSSGFQNVEKKENNVNDELFENAQKIFKDNSS